jgi:hypothetical protein
MVHFTQLDTIFICEKVQLHNENFMGEKKNYFVIK